MLELKPLESTMVGYIDNGGMSFEQKKRVSIGIELASNPAILFLDEPTTGILISILVFVVLIKEYYYDHEGLDSRAAQVVMRSIRRVAASGRSVVCTIHQPSYPIFSAFDSLLLLRRGGQTVFFGPLGDHCENLINFFQDAPGVS
jgi:ABC-type multidrug transport system ATPase subunit